MARQHRTWAPAGGARWLGMACAGLIAAGLLAAYGAWSLSRWAERPLATPAGEVVVWIAPGTSFRAVAAQVAAAGVVDSPRRLEWLARWRGVADRVRAGEYDLGGRYTPEEVLDLLLAGRVKQYPFTVPEGLTCREIASRFAAAGFGNEAEFVAACRDPELLARMGVREGTLEGYLFPETYQWHRGMTARALVERMVAAGEALWTPERRHTATALGMTVHQVLTLASIIEKETGHAGERALISGVFHNRLRRGMRLQSDPTVIYGLADFDGNLTRDHLATDTPYNTYTRAGLPPGPIANPGLESIDAALHPAETPALYFVSRNDGSHQFSATVEEHNRAVDRYQRHR
ncbi:MAG: endolytic transglycosylase MltG [Nitrospirota bacterium]|jgi:UPF0755 protein